MTFDEVNMRRSGTLVLKLLAMALFAMTGAVSGQSSSDSEYEALLSKVKSGNTSVDFKALRMSYAASSGYSSVSIDPKLRLKLIDAVKAKKFDEVAKAAQDILKVSFLDMTAHIYASTAYEALKDKKKSEYHKAVYLGLINSIVTGADGESPKTAYVVISVDEENAVLNAYELQKSGSSSMEEGGHKYDVLTVTDKATGASSKVYFNIDLLAKGADKAVKQ